MIVPGVAAAEHLSVRWIVPRKSAKRDRNLAGRLDHRRREPERSAGNSRSRSSPAG